VESSSPRRRSKRQHRQQSGGVHSIKLLSAVSIPQSSGKTGKPHPEDADRERETFVILFISGVSLIVFELSENSNHECLTSKLKPENFSFKFTLARLLDADGKTSPSSEIKF
jgi:hypothetical protein